MHYAAAYECPHCHIRVTPLAVLNAPGIFLIDHGISPGTAMQVADGFSRIGLLDEPQPLSPQPKVAVPSLVCPNSGRVWLL